MKKIVFLSLNLVIMCFLSLVFVEAEPIPIKTPSIGPVRVEGRQLMVDFDGDGIYQPYFIKGVGYSPYPIGRHPSDWGWPPRDPRIDNIFDDPEILHRDFALLEAMNCNTIRIWKGNDTEAGGRFPVKLTQNTLNLAESYGIKVIAGFWIDTAGPECINGQIVYHAPDFTNPAVRNDYLSRFEEYVNNFKAHPAILFWSIGNENNLHLDPNNPGQIQAWYSLVDEMAQRAHQVEGSTYHQVAVVNGDINYIGDYDSQMENLDIWGANVYRGDSFTDIFNDFSSKSNKPLWIAEYGLDAWYVNDVKIPDDGYEDQISQAIWAGKLWDEMILHKDVTIGGTIMEYSDEWWKPYEWISGGIYNGSQEHFGVGPTDTTCPPDGQIDWWPPAQDNYFNAEWWGIMTIELNPQPFGPDIMTVRQVYYTLGDRFECGGDRGYYAGQDNGKSCDGTHACCANPNMKAKKSRCVYVCNKPFPYNFMQDK